MTCGFCTDGRCLLCQLAAPAEAAVSSSHGRVVKAGELGLGFGCTKRRGGTGEGARGKDAMKPVLYIPRHPQLCPLCGHTALDLYHHYNKKHPGETFRKAEES